MIRSADRRGTGPGGRAGRWMQAAVGAVTLAVAAGVLIGPRMPKIPYDRLPVTLGVIATLVAGGLLHRVRSRLPVPTGRGWDAMAAAICVVGGVVSGLLAYGGAYPTQWDPSVVENASTLSPVQFSPGLVFYFSRYPNIVPLLAVARIVRAVEGVTGLDYQTLFALFNVVALLTAAAAMYLTVRRFRGGAQGVLALLAFGVLLGVSPWLAVPYTDMLAAWIPMVAVALGCAGFSRPGPRGAALISVAGLVLAAGYVLKVTPVVGMAALILTGTVEVVRGAGGRGTRRAHAVGVLSAVVVFVICAPAFASAAQQVADTPRLDPEQAVSPMTYAAAGLRVQTAGSPYPMYGVFDPYVNHVTRGVGRAQQDAIDRRLIALEWHRRGWAGTAGFEWNKALFNWGDGMFWARGEGSDVSAPPLRHDLVSDAVSPFLVPGEALYGFHTGLAQVAWLAVLLVAGAGLLRAPYRPEILLMALTVAAIAVFTLAFQGRSRYLIVHVPVVIALAACVLPGARDSHPQGRHS